MTFNRAVARRGQTGVQFGIVCKGVDPHKAGAFKVRLPEHGGPDKISDEDLPWSIPKGSESSNHQKVGSFINLPPGTKVACMMLDGPGGLMPMIVGPGGQAVGGKEAEGQTKDGATQYELADGSLPSVVRGGEENDKNHWLTDVPPEEYDAAQAKDPKSEVV